MISVEILYMQPVFTFQNVTLQQLPPNASDAFYFDNAERF